MTDEPHAEISPEGRDDERNSAPPVFSRPPQAPLQNEKSAREKDDSNLKREPARLTDHIMAWATVVMALATIAIGGLAYRQWKDSGVLNDAATEAAAAADSFKTSAATAESDLKVMANSSKQSIQATQDALRLDERAWVGPGDSPSPQNLKPGGMPVFAVKLLNTGKTPALNVRETVIWKAAYPGQAFKPIYGKGTSRQSDFVLMPNHTVTASSSSIATFTQANFDDLKAGKYIIRFYGIISYDDVFGSHHRTTFCFYYAAPIIMRSNVCNTYNYAD